MLNIVKQLNASLGANRFLTSFEMTGKKEGGKTILGQIGREGGGMKTKTQRNGQCR